MLKASDTSCLRPQAVVAFKGSCWKQAGRDYNPTGCYRTEFEAPAHWADPAHAVYLHLGAVTSAVYVYVNGQKVGYSVDSKLPAEFDISQHMLAGQTNVVALEVLCWSAATYLERQDMWWLAGITRSVYVFARPLVHVRDFEVRGRAFGGVGRFDVTADLRQLRLPTCRSWACTEQSCYDSYAHVKLTCEVLEDAQGGLPTILGGAAADLDAAGDFAEAIAAQLKPAAPADVAVPRVLACSTAAVTVQQTALGIGGAVVSCSLEIAGGDTQLWSAETPAMYTMLLTLCDASDEVLEVIRLRVGLRESEVRNGRLLVNGREVTLRGVNRQDPAQTRSFKAAYTSSLRPHTLVASRPHILVA